MSDPARRTLILGAAALLAAFLAGAGAGVLIWSDDGSPARSGPPPTLFEDLDLTADQQAHIDSVLMETRRATDRVLEDARADLTTLATDALDAIDEVLTEEQIETVRARIEAREPPRAAPPGDAVEPYDSSGY